MSGFYQTPDQVDSDDVFQWKQNDCKEVSLVYLRHLQGGEGYEETVEVYPSGCGAGADHCDEIEFTESSITLRSSGIMAIGNDLLPEKRVYELLDDGTLRISTYYRSGGIFQDDVEIAKPVRPTS